MKRKRFIIAILVLFCIPAMAVFNERDLGNTLSVLRYELKQEYDRLSATGTDMQALDEEQHQQMVDMIKKYNELSLMLYSQNEAVYNTSVLSHSETPGLGAKCNTDAKFMDQWKGLGADKVIKVTKDGGDIDAITASTITSRAYSLAVSNAVAFVKSIVKAEED